MSAGIIDNLIKRLCMLPGIGRKTAQRLAFFIHNMPADDAVSIADAIYELKKNAKFCSECFNITDSERCEICTDQRRDRTKICVVEEPSNIAVIERSGAYRGLYHVLLGALAPIDGVKPEMLKIRELFERAGKDGVKEVILATNPNTKGELTAQYLREELRTIEGLNVSRIAYGLPLGGDIEFADEVTLRKSLEGRRKF